MAMETSTMPPKAPWLGVEEDALASQVLEIIGGVTLEAHQALDDTEERDLWSMEEGDDSVFYSDEDQAHQDIKANTSCDAGVSECKNPVPIADEPILQREDNSGEDSMTEKQQSETEMEGEEQQALQTPKTEPIDQSDDADPEATPDKTPEKSVGTCGESRYLLCTSTDMQTQSEQRIAAEKVNLPLEEEEAVLDTQTPNLQLFDGTNEESYITTNGDAEDQGNMSSAELQVSGGKQFQPDQEPEQEHDIHVPMGFHQKPSPGYCSLPLLKKSGHQKSFNHLSSSKYSTVSYRKIRRGNTRQKIEAFEYMIMNL